MPGTRAQANAINDTVQGYSNAAVTAALVLFEYVSPAFMHIGAVKAFAVTAGVGAGNTVVDVQINGTSIWTTTPANRPTLASASTGEFANTAPDPGSEMVRPGDRISIVVLSIPATTGHARVMATVALVGD